MFKTWIKLAIQSNISKTSVLNKKEEKLTAGIRKKAIAQKKDNNLFLNSFIESIQIKKDEKIYKRIGIVFKTKKLLPKK